MNAKKDMLFAPILYHRSRTSEHVAFTPGSGLFRNAR
jgi:hypothetical protein